MTDQERDAMLARIDERTQNMWRALETHTQNKELHRPNPGTRNNDFKKWALAFILGMAAAGGGTTLAGLGKFLGG